MCCSYLSTFPTCFILYLESAYVGVIIGWNMGKIINPTCFVFGYIFFLLVHFWVLFFALSCRKLNSENVHEKLLKSENYRILEMHFWVLLFHFLFDRGQNNCM